MSFRTKNHGRTNLLVPGLLLMLGVVTAWILLKDDKQNPNHANNDPSTSLVGPQDHTAEGPDEPFLDGHVPPVTPDRNDQLPVIGTISGKVHAEDWVEWPSGILVTLELQKTGQVMHSQGVSLEEPGFRFEKVEFENYRLAVTGPGMLKSTIPVTVSATTAQQNIYIPLQPAASVHGTVKNADGIVVPEIQVTAIMVTDKPGYYHEPLVGQTDAAGAYLITGLRPGREYQVFVGTYGNPIGESKTVGVSKYAPKAWADFEIPLMGRAVITIDFADGPEVRDEFGKVLRVMAQKEGSESGYSQSLPLNDEWTATFAALPPGEYSFSVYGGSFRRVIKSAGVSHKWETTLTIPVHHLGKGNRPR
ncbi:MAG: carboxypeptidase regulatory-like domain-containing protein [Planctomycetes bacterium]|nr:carboxypeptidase regulatory-like domain-containing protein [Planctomycetota bacterium]MCP4770564.1 carboxypeptidase regulatory-like domain-containing protein [Planctomycetota bacterium]MCP4860345.1 carboxypeptidase regulatory-like domain-containing protein [Planctomycetota bacterium]